MIEKVATLGRRPRSNLGMGVSPPEASGSKPTTAATEAG